jgi:hypothetical protein
LNWDENRLAVRKRTASAGDSFYLGIPAQNRPFR